MSGGRDDHLNASKSQEQRDNAQGSKGTPLASAAQSAAHVDVESSSPIGPSSAADMNISPFVPNKRSIKAGNSGPTPRSKATAAVRIDASSTSSSAHHPGQGVGLLPKNNTDCLVDLAMSNAGVGGDGEEEDHDEKKASHRRLRTVEGYGYQLALGVISHVQSVTCGTGSPIVTGLDHVLNGTAPAAKAVTCTCFRLRCKRRETGGSRCCPSRCYHCSPSVVKVEPPQFFWYALSGTLCDVVQFALDYALHYFFNVDDASTCWALSFTMSIAVRHTSHRYFVFGSYSGGYWSSLLRMYLGYSIIIVLSTVFNIIMIQYLDMNHYIAWVVTLGWSGIVSYILLQKLWACSSSGTSKVKGGSRGQRRDENVSQDTSAVADEDLTSLKMKG